MLTRDATKLKDNTYYCNIHEQQFKLADEFYNAGYGCPMCATDNNSCNPKHLNECYLYLIEITIGDVILYKIGIATNGVSKRYQIQDRKYFTDIQQWKYTTKVEALKAEAKTLAKNAHLSYTGDRVLACVGTTEIFVSKPNVVL